MDDLLGVNRRTTAGGESSPGEPNVPVKEADRDEENRERECGEDGHSAEAIRLYLREIRQIKPLTRDEERELAGRVAAGDHEARNRMIECNLRWVVKIAKSYQGRGLPLLDLIAEGNIGLIRAVEGFNVSKDCRFSTYGTWWIRQSIERALANQSRTIRLPIHISDRLRKIVKVSRDLLPVLSRQPQVDDIADALDMASHDIQRLLVLVRKTYSIEHPMGEYNDYSLLDIIEDSTSVDPLAFVADLNLFDQVTEWMKRLGENEREVISRRFGLDDGEAETLEAIGKRLGVSRERIRQIEERGLEKLRVSMRRQARRCGFRGH